MYACAAFLAPSNVKLGNALTWCNLLNMFEGNNFESNRLLLSEELLGNNVKTEQRVFTTSTRKRTIKRQLPIQTRSKNYVSVRF